MKTNFIYLSARAGENENKTTRRLHTRWKNKIPRADDDAVIIMITRPIYLRCIVLTGGDVNYALTAGGAAGGAISKQTRISLARPPTAA